MRIGLLIDDLDRLDDVAAWGYDYAEVVPSLLGPDAGDPRAERDARARILSSPVPVPVMCGFLPDPERSRLMVVGPDVDAARLRAYVARLFDRMRRAGIGVIGYGSGASRTVPDGFSRETALDQVGAFLRMCGELGSERGVRVAVEPYNRDDTNLLHTVPETLELVRRLDHPNVGLMADFFHMRLNGEPLDELVDAGPWLIHAHVAEPGRGRRATTADDHRAFVRALRGAGYDGALTQTGPLVAYQSAAAAARSLRRMAAEGSDA